MQKTNLILLLTILLFPSFVMPTVSIIDTESYDKFNILSEQDVRKDDRVLTASNILPSEYENKIQINRGIREETPLRVIQSRFQPLANWTVMVYLDGDNDLEEYAFIDFNSMELVGSTTNVRIIVLVDFWSGTDAPFTGAKCYEILYDSNMNAINSLELATGLPTEPNMGSWETLRDFIVFSQTFAPAQNYMLVIWDHGAGFYGLCTDDTSNDFLSIRELDQALSDPGVQYLDIVAFDACLMGQLEVAYEIRDTTDILVFSEEGIPVNGFPYDDILLNLTLFPQSTPRTVASGMVYYYTAAYGVGGQYYDPLLNYVCLSAVDTSILTTVAQALSRLSHYLLTMVDVPIFYDWISQARRDTQGFTNADFMDLNGFANEIIDAFGSLSYSLVRDLALNLSAAVNDAVLEERHLSGVSGASGLGSAFCSYGSTDLELANDTSWDVFMDTFINVGSDIDVAIVIDQMGEHFGYLDGNSDSVYYEFTPNVNAMYVVDLQAAWEEYTTDFDLHLYDNSVTELTSSVSADSTESVSQYLIAGITYFIEVYSYPGDYQGIGVFQLVVYSTFDPGGPPTPFPPIIVFMMILGTMIAIVAVVLAIIHFILRRPRDSPPPPRYTTPRFAPPASPDAMQFCAYCGGMIPTQARYCPTCGASKS